MICRLFTIILALFVISCNSEKPLYWRQVAKECYDSTLVKYKRDSVLFTELEVLLPKYYDTLGHIDSVISESELSIKIKDSLLSRKLKIFFKTYKIDSMIMHPYIYKTIAFENHDTIKTSIREPFQIIPIVSYEIPTYALFFVFDSVAVQQKLDLNVFLYDSTWSNYQFFYRISNNWHLATFIDKW